MATQSKRASIELGGDVFVIKAGSAKLVPGGPSGSPVVADDGTVHTSYEPKEGMLECTILMIPSMADLYKNKLANLQDSTGTFQWVGGPGYSLTGVTANDAGSWSWDGEGLAVKFHMNPAQPL